MYYKSINQQVIQSMLHLNHQMFRSISLYTVAMVERVDSLHTSTAEPHDYPSSPKRVPCESGRPNPCHRGLPASHLLRFRFLSARQ